VVTHAGLVGGTVYVNSEYSFHNRERKTPEANSAAFADKLQGRMEPSGSGWIVNLHPSRHGVTNSVFQSDVSEQGLRKWKSNSLDTFSFYLLPFAFFLEFVRTGRHGERSAQCPAVTTAAHTPRHESTWRDLFPCRQRIGVRHLRWGGGKVGAER
jgi:hypothetical protein